MAQCGRRGAVWKTRYERAKAELQQAREQIVRLDALIDKGLFAELSEARTEAQAMRELLGRIRQWDHLDGAADGPYWKGEIANALARLDSASGQVEKDN